MRENIKNMPPSLSDKIKTIHAVYAKEAHEKVDAVINRMISAIMVDVEKEEDLTERMIDNLNHKLKKAQANEARDAASKKHFARVMSRRDGDDEDRVEGGKAKGLK